MDPNFLQRVSPGSQRAMVLSALRQARTIGENSQDHFASGRPMSCADGIQIYDRGIYWL